MPVSGFSHLSVLVLSIAGERDSPSIPPPPPFLGFFFEAPFIKKKEKWQQQSLAYPQEQEACSMIA
jgi:hypothetical protein